MADLPMAQIPQFSLGATPNINPAIQNGLQGMQNGASTAIQAAQFQQQQAQAQKQQAIEKNMKMLETGSQMMIEGGPEVQQTGQDLIKQSYPFLTGQPLPEGMPLDKNTAKDLGWYMDQHRLWQKTQGSEGLSAQDAVTGATQAISRYGSKYQQQQMGLLEKTPLYKEATANQEPGQVNGSPANFNPQSGQPTVQGNGQPMSGNFVPNTTMATIQNEHLQSLKSTFMEATKDQQQVLPDFRDFSTMMQPVNTANLSPDQKAQVVANQKVGLLKYMQMQVPASRRPPNLAAMDNLSQDDLVTQKAAQAYNRLFKTGEPLTPQMLKAIRATGTQTALSAEKNLSGLENSWAANAQSNQVDPKQVLSNFRPSTIASSSKFFPSQSAPTWDKAAIGQVVPGPNGARIFLGGNRTNPDNWAEAPASE